MWRSNPGRRPSPKCSASCGVTMNPEPCNLTPGEHKPSLARRADSNREIRIDAALLGREFNFGLIGVEFGFPDDLAQHARMDAGLTDRHCDAHCGGFLRCLRPRMIWD